VRHKRHKDGRHILAELSGEELHALRDGLWYRKSAVLAAQEQSPSQISLVYVNEVVDECDRLMALIPERRT